MKRVLFLVVLISLLTLTIYGCGNQITGSNSNNQVPSISVAELKKQLSAGIGNNTIIVDLREPVIYNKEHIPGAILIPFANFENKYTQLDKNKRIILVCHTGPMGDAAGQFLKTKGYEQILNLEGGMQAWDEKS